MKNDFTPTVGAKFTFRTQPMPHWNGVVECEVLAVEPHQRLSYSWNAGGRQKTADHRHLDARARPGRHAAAHGAVGLRAAGRQQLQGRGLRLAAQYRGAGEGGRGARLTMKTGVPLSPASGDAALAAGRADPGGPGGGLPGPRQRCPTPIPARSPCCAGTWPAAC